jgi:hypothetical protein
MTRSMLMLLVLLATTTNVTAITVYYTDGSIKEVDDSALQGLRNQQPFLVVPNPAPIGYKHGLFMTVRRGAETYVRSLSFGTWNTPTIPPQGSHDRTRYKEYGCELTVLPGTILLFRTNLYTRVYTADTTPTVHSFPLSLALTITWVVQPFNGPQNAVFGMDGHMIAIPTTSVIVPLPTKGIVFLNIGDTSCCISIWMEGKRVERKCASQTYVNPLAEAVSVECGPNQGPYAELLIKGDKQLVTIGHTKLDPPNAIGMITVPENHTLETWDMDGHTFIFGPGKAIRDNYAIGVVNHIHLRKTPYIPSYPYLYDISCRRPLYLPLGISKVGRSGLWEYHGSTMTHVYVPNGMSITVYKHRYFDKHDVNPRVWKYGPGEHDIRYGILDTSIIGLLVEQEEQKQ